ncbi:MAG: RagB/SusD family nutrient uptake outer membrane protein, partial [Bacteroidales bacterium]|nr:RagB/SusD family nutrient uptake outer membrane protein [Bacteroidales bacterium]
MKYKIKIESFLLLMFIILISGCEKFLEEDLKGQRSDTQFFKSAEDAELALSGIYNVTIFADADNRVWVFGDVASDDAAKGGILGDQADIGLIDDFNVTADNGNLETVWGIYYEGISRANLLIDNIDGIDMDGTRKNEITGEAKFLRAYFYFWLVNIFGDIPVHITTPTPEEMQKPATPADDIFSSVIEPDLKDAASKLPENASPANIGRATKGAAWSFLTKVLLFQEKWSEAEDAARHVTDEGMYSLVHIYRNNFELATKNNQEIVFAIQHLDGQEPWLGNRLNQWFAPRVENGYGFNVPTQNFVDEFEMTTDSIYDPRLDYTVGRKGKPWFNDTVPFNPEWSPTGYMQKKYLQPLDEVPVELKADGELNYVFMRYADVLLMLAEALNEQGNSAEAVVYVNMVRKRARESYLYDDKLPGYGTIPDGLLPDITDGGQNAVRDAIRHERRVELGFEFHRYFDIIRYGEAYANSAFQDKVNFNYEQYKHFPIPQRELDTNHEL